MPFSLPSKVVSWNRRLQTRCAYTSVNQAAGDVMYQVANELITTRGFTCKGSSDGTTAAMDGTFRWSSGNNAKTRFNGAAGAQSWVVITLAGSRGDVVFSYNGATDDVYNIWWSPSGVATVAGTATFEPTATDQVLLNKYYTTTFGTVVGTATSGDRLVSIWSRPDKAGFRVAIASAGAWISLFGFDVFTPDTYGAGITLLDVTGFYINGAWNATLNGATAPNIVNGSGLANSGTTAQKRFMGRRTDGGGTTLEYAHKMKVVGQQTGGSAISAVIDSLTAPLQGGSTWPMKRYGLYSVTTSHQGDVGTLTDWYISRTAAADGDTAGSLDWICVESTASFWWDWDGATTVVLS
jgi:hypothetical protein